MLIAALCIGSSLAAVCIYRWGWAVGANNGYSEGWNDGRQYEADEREQR